jgi:hypothetical protein
MNKLMCSLGLNCLVLGAAMAGDAAERLRDRFCSQFVIEEPAPPVFWDSVRDCCRHGRLHDCRLPDPNENSPDGPSRAARARRQ